MKITILTTSFPEYPGDLAGIFVALLARELSRQSLHVRVIAPHSPSSPRKEVMEGVPVSRFQYFYPAAWQKLAYGHGIPANLRSSWFAKIGVLPFFMAFFLKIIRSKRLTDVYHAQWIFSGLAAVIGRKIHRKPILLTVRGSDLNFAQGRSFQFLAKYILTRVSLITTVSEALRQKVLELGVPVERVHTIPNGVDCQTFRPLPKDRAREALKLMCKRKIVVWAGRFVPVKGVDFLVEAIPKILQDEPETYFVLVGTGNLEDEFKYKVRKLGISNQVLFAGKVPVEQMPLWLNTADVFVLPSLNEGRPNALLEAMACEVPVIASKVGGIPEIVRDGKNGFLVPPKNSSFLAERVLHLLQEPRLCSSMGQNGRRMIFDMGLSWEQCARKMIHLYQQAMGCRQK